MDLNDFTKVGIINLIDTKMLIISDPCYDNDDTGVYQCTTIYSGMYNCYVERENKGIYGNRVKSMLIINCDFENDNFLIREKKSSVFVDSGTMGIYDSSYFEKYHSNDSETDKELHEKWYKENVVSWCMKKDSHICDDKGFISESGYGDGEYNLYLLKDNFNKIIGVQVVFIDEYDEDCEYVEDYVYDED